MESRAHRAQQLRLRFSHDLIIGDCPDQPVNEALLGSRIQLLEATQGIAQLTGPVSRRPVLRAPYRQHHGDPGLEGDPRAVLILCAELARVANSTLTSSCTSSSDKVPCGMRAFNSSLNSVSSSFASENSKASMRASA